MMNTTETTWRVCGWEFLYSPDTRKVVAHEPNGSQWSAESAPNLATASRIVREWRSELGLAVIPRKRYPRAVYSKRLGRWVLPR